MTGETVTITQRSEVGRDGFNNPIFEDTETDVENVLVAPATGDDVIESVRPEGSEVKYTLYFPKTFVGKLENERVKVRGDWLDVIGCPDCFDLNNCPTDWNMVVKVGVFHG